jgi:hypothetical protein
MQEKCSGSLKLSWIVALAVAAFVLAATSCNPKAKFPGRVILLSQGTIYVITQDGTVPLLTDVVTAAVSPDGRTLLYTKKDQAILRDLEKGADKIILPETGLKAGWNEDGTRYYLLTGCPANRLYVGQPEGEAPLRLFQGRKGLYVTGGSEGASIEEEVCAELGGCLFLTNDLLVFSAFDAPMPRQGDIYANKGYLVDLAATPPELRSTEFPRQARWRFVDASETSGQVLISVERNPESAELFQNKVYTCPRFQEWEQISFQNELQLSFARWENGGWGNAGELAGLFSPQTGRVFGLANEQTPKGWNLYYIVIDPESGETQRGPALPLAPGQVVNRPVFDPEERYAAFLANLGGEENITVCDMSAGTSSKIWKIKAPKGAAFDARLDRLLAWLD